MDIDISSQPSLSPSLLLLITIKSIDVQLCVCV